MNDVIIRSETEADYRRVEEITREAFWNLYVPGCCEHYLVHIMRGHRDFVGDLDYVAVIDGTVVGSILFSKSAALNENDEKIDTITFGPVSVLPEYQRKGIGSILIQYTLQKACKQGYKAVIIYGNPKNYCKFGFKSSKDYRISTMDGKYPFSLLVLELDDGAFAGHTWRYLESDVYAVDSDKAADFDKTFGHKEKGYRYTQEEFMIACRAYIE